MSSRKRPLDGRLVGHEKPVVLVHADVYSLRCERAGALFLRQQWRACLRPVQAEDNVGRQVCADQTLHRWPPWLAFLCRCYPSTSAIPPRPRPRGKMALTAASIVLFCEVGMKLPAIYRLALGERRRGGAGGQWVLRGSLGLKTQQNVNKEGRFLFVLKDELSIVTCGRAVWFRGNK